MMLRDSFTTARDVRDRIEAAIALAERGDPRGVEVLLEILSREPDSGYRRSAVDGLTRIRCGDPRVVEGLLSALRDDLDPDEWAMVAWALAECGGERAVAPILSGLAKRPALWFDMPSAGGRRVGALVRHTLESLARRGLIDESRIDAFVDPLMCRRDPWAPEWGEPSWSWDEEENQAMIRQLPDIQAAAASVLGAIGGRRAADVLLEAIEEAHDPLVRCAIARALGTRRELRALAPLQKMLATDRDPAARCAAAEALGNLGDARAIPALLGALATADSPMLRRAAAGALAAIDPGRWIPPVPSARQ